MVDTLPLLDSFHVFIGQVFIMQVGEGIRIEIFLSTNICFFLHILS